MKRLFTLTAAALLGLGSASAQMAKGHSKFLGNITTSYSWQEYCDPQECDLKYTDYWNQVTCENACKWGSVHQGWGKFNWSNADRTYNYCKQNGIIFKFHALIWGSQHPGWIESLSVADTKKAIIEWYDEVKKHYPDLPIIDVVNEAVYAGGNYHSPYKETKIIEALGSLAEDRLGQRFNCTTNGYPDQNSYQWLAEAFRLARERWPNAILIYNDYNTFQWQKNEFIALVNGIKACGGPIDAAGNQAHDLNEMSGSAFKSALEEIHNKTQLPQYITEYDIAKKNDNTFLTRYKEQFPVMWEADYVAGVTLWGWIYGKTWVSDEGDGGASGLVRNCQKRSAFTWLEEYMKSDAAKNAKSPIVGGPSVSAIISLSEESVEVGGSVKISVSADATKGIDHVDIYAGSELLVNKYIAPYEWDYTAAEVGKVTIKVVAFDKEGNKRETTKDIIVCEARTPFDGAIELPGVIEVENFDRGCAGISYSDSDDKNEGASETGASDYRKDGSGVDIVSLSSGGYALGYTAAGEWLEYTVNVKSAGNYSFKATVSSGNDNASFHLDLKGAERPASLTGKISIPAGEDWDTYTTVDGKLNYPLEAGEQIIRLTIDGAYGNIDNISFSCDDCTTNIDEIAAGRNYVYQVYTTTGAYVGVVTVNRPSEVGGALYDLTNQEGSFLLRDTETGISKLYISRK